MRTGDGLALARASPSSDTEQTEAVSVTVSFLKKDAAFPLLRSLRPFTLSGIFQLLQ